MLLKSEIKKQLLLASCEKEHLQLTLEGLKGKFSHVINWLDDLIALHAVCCDKLQEYQRQYIMLSSEKNTNKDKELSDINERITNVRIQMHVSHVKVTTALSTIFANILKIKKHQVELALSNICEYKENLNILDKTLKLEDYPNLENDYKKVIVAQKILRQMRTQLTQLTHNFTEQFVAVEDSGVNVVRFIYQDIKMIEKDTKLLDQSISKYEKNLWYFRETFMDTISNYSLLVGEDNQFDKIFNQINQLLEKSKPENVKPSEKKMEPGTGGRILDMPQKLYNEIRAERFKYFSEENLAENKRLEEITNKRLNLAFFKKKEEPGNTTAEDRKLSQLKL